MTAPKPVPKPACPICGRPTEPRWRPFCSKRCADVDLGRWLTGRYAVPAEESPGPDSGPGAGSDNDDRGDGESR